MRKILVLALLFCSTMVVYSQSENNYSQSSTRPIRYIEVIGSAEKEVVADKFVLSISVREYFNDDKKEDKVSIQTIEADLIRSLRRVGINNDDVVVSSIGDFWRDNKDKDYLISKTVNVNMSDIAVLNQLLKVINTKSINYMRITNLTNKDIIQHRKDVRIAALQAAKEKASYLLESVDEVLGDVISISESTYQDRNYEMSNKSLALQSASDSESLDGLRKIVLRYDINVRFEIKRKSQF